MTGPDAARALARAGFRVVPNLPETKKPPPRVFGFGEAYPDFSYPPEHFEPDEYAAVLCGLGQDVLFQNGDELTVFDLDGGADLHWLEAHVGKLPPTLTTKAGAHLFFRHERRNDFRQWGDALKTRPAPKQGLALDVKRRGGYARQPLGDRGFADRTGTPIALEALTIERVRAEIAELPSAVIDLLVKKNAKRRAGIRCERTGELDFEEGRDWRDYTERWSERDLQHALDDLVQIGPVGNDGLMRVATALRRWGFGLQWGADGTPSGSAVTMFELWDRVTAPAREGAPAAYWFVPEWVGAVHRALARCAPCRRRLSPAEERGIRAATAISERNRK